MPSLADEARPRRPDFWKKDLVEGKDLRELTTLNLGPTHPATHGIFQNVLTLDGEIILDTEQTIGYIHRAFEKIAERRPFYQITTLTDRMNYCSAPINNMGWHMTMEKLLGIELPKRVQYMRVVVMELARIADHIICNTIVGQDAGRHHALPVRLPVAREDLRGV
jgi:NADH-quinone oxidoreductase subunit D